MLPDGVFQHQSLRRGINVVILSVANCPDAGKKPATSQQQADWNQDKQDFQIAPFDTNQSKITPTKQSPCQRDENNIFFNINILNLALCDATESAAVSALISAN
jgi:hypothetical protein